MKAGEGYLWSLAKYVRKNWLILKKPWSKIHITLCFLILEKRVLLIQEVFENEKILNIILTLSFFKTYHAYIRNAKKKEKW